MGIPVSELRIGHVFPINGISAWLLLPDELQFKSDLELALFHINDVLTMSFPCIPVEVGSATHRAQGAGI